MKKGTLGGNIVLLTSSKVITLLISTVSLMLLARFRTLKEYGTYSQLMLVAAIFTTMLMLGLPNSINYFLVHAESQEDRRKFLSLYYSLGSGISIIIGVILLLSIPLIETYFHNPLIKNYFYFLALYPWTTIISASIENLLIVYEKTRFLMVYRILNSLALLGIILLIQLLGLGFDAYMIAFVAVNSAFTLWIYIIASKLCGGLSFLLDKSMIKAVFAFSLPIGLAVVVGTLSIEIDKLLIGYLMDTEQMGIYTNAAKELPLSVVSASITAVLLPKATKMIKDNKTKEAIKLWCIATELALLVMCLIVAGVFTYAEEVMTVLYSAKYLPGVSVFRIYTLNLILRCTYFGMILNAYGKTKKILICSSVSLIVNIILNPLMYYFLGIIGPAIATFISILLVQLLQLKMTSKVTDIPFKNIFPWLRTLMIIAVNTVFAAAFFVIKKYLPLNEHIGEVAESIVLGGIWSVLYFIVMKKRIMNCWRTLNREGE